jgi:hypothetical protein
MNPDAVSKHQCHNTLPVMLFMSKRPRHGQLKQTTSSDAHTSMIAQTSSLSVPPSASLLRTPSCELEDDDDITSFATESDNDGADLMLGPDDENDSSPPFSASMTSQETTTDPMPQLHDDITPEELDDTDHNSLTLFDCEGLIINHILS